VLGETPYDNPNVLRSIGYCPEGDSLPGDLSPMEWLAYLGGLSGFTRSDSLLKARTLLNKLQFPREANNRRLTQISKGQRQRVRLAQSLLHQPRLLLLDEPMNGLDPASRLELTSLLRELASEGTSILLSSHILHELESLCSHLVMMNHGKVLSSGTQDEIRLSISQWPETLRLTCSDPRKLAMFLFEGGHLKGFRLEGDTVEIDVADTTRFHSHLASLVMQSGVQVTQIRPLTHSLEDVFLRITL
ncbi:MAG: ATP-binding cassette domain-containing protein, partial [Planctomycetota bacterium]